MNEAIYDNVFESPDLAKFLVGIGDLILQQAPPHQYGALVSILNPLVTWGHYPKGCPVGGCGLGKTEHLQTRYNIQMLKGAEVLLVTKTRKPLPQTPQVGPIQVSQKQMNLCELELCISIIGKQIILLYSPVWFILIFFCYVVLYL